MATKIQAFVAEVVIASVMLRGEALTKEQQNKLADSLMIAVEKFVGIYKEPVDVVMPMIVRAKRPRPTAPFRRVNKRTV